MVLTFEELDSDTVGCAAILIDRFIFMNNSAHKKRRRISGRQDLVRKTLLVHRRATHFFSVCAHTFRKSQSHIYYLPGHKLLSEIPRLQFLWCRKPQEDQGGWRLQQLKGHCGNYGCFKHTHKRGRHIGTTRFRKTLYSREWDHSVLTTWPIGDSVRRHMATPFVNDGCVCVWWFYICCSWWQDFVSEGQCEFNRRGLVEISMYVNMNSAGSRSSCDCAWEDPCNYTIEQRRMTNSLQGPICCWWVHRVYAPK